jgi:hypothetical protein
LEEIRNTNTHTHTHTIGNTNWKKLETHTHTHNNKLETQVENEIYFICWDFRTYWWMNWRPTTTRSLADMLTTKPYCKSYSSCYCHSICFKSSLKCCWHSICCKSCSNWCCPSTCYCNTLLSIHYLFDNLVHTHR